MLSAVALVYVVGTLVPSNETVDPETNPVPVTETPVAAAEPTSMEGVALPPIAVMVGFSATMTPPSPASSVVVPASSPGAGPASSMLQEVPLVVCVVAGLWLDVPPQ